MLWVVVAFVFLAAACTSGDSSSSTTTNDAGPVSNVVGSETTTSIAGAVTTTGSAADTTTSTTGAEATTALVPADTSPMMGGRNGYVVGTLYTVGDAVDGFQPIGVLDGIGAFEFDSSTVRLLVNHEVRKGDGYIYELANGTQVTGARVSYFDIDKATLEIVAAGAAYDTIYDRSGSIVTRAAQINEEGHATDGLSRFCSAQYVAGGDFGFVDDIFFTNEEVGTWGHPHGGSVWALDVANNALWGLPELGRGVWENVTPLDTGDPETIALLLGEDNAPAPMYLWVGRLHPEAEAENEFVRRNGLEDGTLFVWVADDQRVRSRTDFNGTGAHQSGTFMPITVQDDGRAGNAGYDADGYKDENTLKTEGFEDLGAFRFPRPEDVATDPVDGTVAAYATTGADDWGAVYIVDVDFTTLDSPTAEISILHDGNDFRDEGIRNPDNLDWADNGYIYIQEDKSLDAFGSTTGRDTSILKIDPVTGTVVLIAEMDRDVVLPAGSLDPRAGGLGEWESSGVLDVTDLFDLPEGVTLLVATVQAHSLTDGSIAQDALVEGGN